MSSQAAAGAGTHEFRAETQKLLDIVVHSLYSEKEIFLRELISNASDALDRLRFETLTDPDLTEKGEILEIRLDIDEGARSLSVSDNGIGMSREEVIENLGTIAKSGTREVLARVEEAGGAREGLAELIGQFGVGFYSAFMVADKVTVVTRRAGEEKATRWESAGEGAFEIADDSRFLRGTTVTLHLKPVDEENGIEDYTDVSVLRRIVKRYSDFIPYPIRVKEAQENGKTEEVTLNSMKPIWTGDASAVSDEEYTEFYHHISHDWGDPLDRLSLRAEGRIEYQALLFIPSHAPFDLYYRDQQVGLRLYVKRVLIMDRCEALVPPWLRFLRGVVDSADLPLNVSREMLQQDRHILQMRKWITRKVVDHLEAMKAGQRDKYLGFWREFGRVLKEGVGSDREHRERIVPLLLFRSSTEGDELTDLAGYLERMQDDQQEIYYLTGESRSVVESSPHLEAFQERGYEVLYLTDPIDEFMVQALDEHQGKKLRSAAQGGLDLGSEEEREKTREELEKKRDEYGALLGALQRKLDRWVREVRLSNRLRTSPSCLVTGEGELSPHLERLLRQSESGLEIPEQKRVLELNPDHEVIARLEERCEENRDDPVVDDYAHLLLGYALIAEGSELPDPGRFNRLLAELMGKGL